MGEEGETVVVCGRAHLEPDGGPSKVVEYRELPTRLVLRGDEKLPMLISDDPKLVSLDSE